MSMIGIIRHGITPWNQEGRFQGHRDVPLAEEGILQAQALARRLNTEPWDVIVSSDLMRAKQTAEIVAEQLGIETVLVDERLREISGGLLDGTTESERVAKWGNDWYNMELGLESEASCRNRGSACLEELADRYAGKRVLVVSHGTLLGYTLNGLLPKDEERGHLLNTSLTKLIKKNDGWACELYNCTKHLDA
ncbi:histidine phosphatase family protein [Paenibacillus selenitireducens]|uniref:Histidine phosphatase family protein n=2 Tax=Paenibacillus selenitireducens TaxID=1324314 RepID=A0A1T2XD30_9BACL|nr:histidine phosphatase family protein [Paenibacillus selenitireducens]OPA77745.1 histidine phosphatase family protein [Paenibacillus selenitireducens]